MAINVKKPIDSVADATDRGVAATGLALKEGLNQLAANHTDEEVLALMRRRRAYLNRKK